MTLAVSHLRVSIKGREILHGIDLEAHSGWFGVLGVNGSGKTTLLKTLCARMDIEAGRVLWQGRDLTHHPAERAQRFGFAPPLDTLPLAITAGELIGLVADLRGCDESGPADIRKALGLDGLRDRLIGNMSSGMKQRVSLFCAFLGEPELVLLDEPFNWLDPVAAHDLKHGIQAWAEKDRCVITALHDVGTFVTRCNSGVLIHEGRVVRGFEHEQMAQGRLNPQALEDEIYALFPREQTVV